MLGETGAATDFESRVGVSKSPFIQISFLGAAEPVSTDLAGGSKNKVFSHSLGV